jgi:hypothetical protein
MCWEYTLRVPSYRLRVPTLLSVSKHPQRALQGVSPFFVLFFLSSCFFKCVYFLAPHPTLPQAKTLQNSLLECYGSLEQVKLVTLAPEMPGT